jgi:NADPH:quinone reductase-like Zn-dependent oxidoreductase
LPTNSPQVHEALCQLGHSASADYDEEEIVEEVGKILENAVDLVENY